ncbi:S-adenosyl-L-methionine-dependent methyltransferase [Syncephalis plumigaleata]|nr:S-adenosyl-L-methionine-dependent methyltransferase [Syncephalis plumigaleata]
MSAGAGDRSRQSSRLPPLPPSPKTADCFPGPSSSITQVTSGPSSLPLSMVSSHAVMQSPVVVKPLESRSASSRMSRKESSHTLKSTRNSSQHSSLDINREFTLASPATMSSASNFNEFVQSSLTAGGNKLRKRSTTQMSIHPQHRGISTPILPETPRRSTNTAPCSRNVSIDLVMLSPSDTIASLPVSRHGSVNSAASAHSSRRKSVDTARSTPCSSKRRFRNKSALPAITIKDQHELDRQDQLHYLLRTFLHNNHLAFINTTGNILDIMTGSGVWALEMASEYPACQVHGVDLLPAQPSHVLPPNCHFRLTISMTALPYQNDEFEYLHHRFVALHVPREIQPAYWHECYRVCKHGGIIEVQERNMVMRNVGEIGQQINIWLGSILIHQNGIPLAVQEIANDIKCAGFHILDTQELPVAVGQWAGNMGAAGFAEIRSFLEEHREYLVRLFTLEDGEFDHLLADWQTEINTYRTVWTLQVIIARKI